MTLLVLTQASGGAPACEGVNGSMNAVINFCVTHASLGGDAWAREHNNAGSFTSIWRPAIGNRFRLYCRHDSSVSGGAQRAIVRGCESASAYNVRVDEFPTSSQVADASSNWLASTTADGTDRNWIAVVTGTFLILAVKTDGNLWDYFFFGDVPGTESGDAYDTVCMVRNSATATSSIVAVQPVVNTGTSAGNIVFWARDISGAVKSSRGAVYATGNALGLVTSGYAMKGGYGNRINREKIALTCGGSTTTTAGVLGIIRRGWLPNIWNPLHTASSASGVVSEDTATDTPYHASALFRVLQTVNSMGSSFILEESDTWSAPSG